MPVRAAIFHRDQLPLGIVPQDNRFAYDHTANGLSFASSDTHAATYQILRIKLIV